MMSLKRFVFGTFLLLAITATVPGAAPSGVASLSAASSDPVYLLTVDKNGKFHCHEEGTNCHGDDE